MHLTEKQLKLITDVASQNAIKAYRDYTEQQQQEKKDRRLRNIKLLLKNYRSFVKHCDDIIEEIQDLDTELEVTLLDSEEFAIEAIKRSKLRTLSIVRFTQKMIRVYETTCEEEGPEAIRRFKVLRELYITEPKKSIREVANVLFLSEKTIKRDRDKAVEALSVLMFGVDAVKFK
ncbi:hypothetical protein AQ616_18390 [Oceanobacillus sp. E9]|uniref:hypothetical protein n=1 Tax=Oceanobacillus sp. E9 TaxID=1742575 RepID=UPI00084EA0F6|nr:hypothetical protein [Oceanobacillus sp. E9]OEH53009.1 hypothetical protein AQ616_18390 [Oceanobacillus sp. E9]